VKRKWGGAWAQFRSFLHTFTKRSIASCGIASKMTSRASSFLPGDAGCASSLLNFNRHSTPIFVLEADLVLSPNGVKLERAAA